MGGLDKAKATGFFENVDAVLGFFGLGDYDLAKIDSEMQNLSAAIRHDLYGGALTKDEVKNWLKQAGNISKGKDAFLASFNTFIKEQIEKELGEVDTSYNYAYKPFIRAKKSEKEIALILKEESNKAFNQAFLDRF